MLVSSTRVAKAKVLVGSSRIDCLVVYFKLNFWFFFLFSSVV